MLQGKGFTYDAVFGPDSTQQEVYNCGVSDIVNGMLLRGLLEVIVLFIKDDPATHTKQNLCQ